MLKNVKEEFNSSPGVGMGLKSPQHEAGRRIDPPLEHPWNNPWTKRLWKAPNRRGLVVGRMPNSWLLVFPEDEQAGGVQPRPGAPVGGKRFSKNIIVFKR